MNMTIPEIHWAPMVAALVYSVIGLAIFAVAFVLVDRLTPYHLWKEIIDEHNTALAIIVGAVAIGISIIISSAIR
jgi:putative membrane protein